MRADPIDGIEACAFDAYGTLFDVDAAARGEQARLGDAWKPLAERWRLRQLQYTWLRGLGGRHADFWQVTGDALDHAMASLGIADAPLRARLMDLYRTLGCYDEVPGVLTALRKAGLRTAIVSNGTPMMLEAAARSAGIRDLLDDIVSVEALGVYKPHPSVYRLAQERLDRPARAIAFVSANGWDAHSAQANGLRAVWCNRSGQPPERIPDAPEREIASLAQLPSLLIGDRRASA